MKNLNGNIFLLFLSLFLLTSVLSYAQNSKNFYYIIRKKDIESGKLKIIYRDQHDSVQPIKMCYPSLRAEGLYIDNGTPSFHFEAIPSSKYDSIPDCISNNTQMGHFEIDIKKRKIGDPSVKTKIPFRAFNWNASLMLYKIRFAPHNPPYAVSDPASMLVSVTYGYTFGYAKISHESISHYYLTIGPMIGLTSAALNGSTVNNPAVLTQEQSNVAFSYGISTIWGRNNFGLTLSCGFDMSIGPNSGLWIYQNKPWLAFGVNTSIGMF